MSIKLTSKVIQGKREGSKIGFPTANMRAEHKIEPGIYAGYAYLDKNEDLKALFYIPKEDKTLVECHILDFPNTDLYGREITVEIAHKLRDVQAFSGQSGAVKQIKLDEQNAREWFNDND